MKRKYLNRIEVYSRATMDDGAGGSTTTELKLSDSWCNIKTVPVSNFKDYGLDVDSQSIRIKLRSRSDINYSGTSIFFKYKERIG